MEDEIWKPIPGFDNRYEASSLGRIRCERKGWARNRDPLVSYYRHPSGYLRCALVTQAGTFQKGVHQLVALAFLGPCPRKREVNHKNRNKADNRPENLEYVTHAANIHHARRLAPWMQGEAAPGARLKDADVLLIRQLLNEGHQGKAIASRFNVSPMTISDIKTGATWKHLA